MSTALPVLETKYDEAMAIVKRNMGWSAGAGILPFPVFDMAAITVVQLKLIKELADLYGVPYTKNMAKSILISLVGTLGSSTIAGVGAVTALKFLPVLGPLIAVTSLSAASAGVAYAVGQVFIQHFEAGGTLLDFEPATVKTYFREQFEAGMTQAGGSKAKA